MEDYPFKAQAFDFYAGVQGDSVAPHPWAKKTCESFDALQANSAVHDDLA
jgi:hypothetical protein